MGMEIFKCLSPSRHIKLFAVSNDVSNHIPYLYRKSFTIKSIYEEGCLEELNEIVVNEKIDYIYPANPLVIDFLNDNRDVIKCKVLLSPRECVRIVRSKKKTYEEFKDLIPVPKVYLPDEVSSFPVFMKPDNSYGSQGSKLIESKKELSLVDNFDPYVLCEYLPGTEYSIDCFSSLRDGVLFCSGRVRRRVRTGTSMSAYLCPEPLQQLFLKYARIMQTKLSLRGGWFFQMKDNKDGKPTLLEIEPRIAGTMALNRVRGINFPMLTLSDWEGIEPEFLLNSCDVELDRALLNRYKHDIDYSTVYIELENTLLDRGRVNHGMMKLLYQAINQDKKIHLLSRIEPEEGEAELSRLKIDRVFDGITWLKDGEDISSHIVDKKSVLIDDLFMDRKTVSGNIGVPTFDLSMIEMLIDDRID